MLLIKVSTTKNWLLLRWRGVCVLISITILPTLREDTDHYEQFEGWSDVWNFRDICLSAGSLRHSTGRMNGGTHGAVRVGPRLEKIQSKFVSRFLGLNFDDCRASSTQRPALLDGDMSSDSDPESTASDDDHHSGIVKVRQHGIGPYVPH